MQKDKIEAAIDAATKMISTANKYLDDRFNFFETNVYEHHFNAPKQSGALRRASMELTRALAEMRKS